jgi:hypothetical protein
MHFSGRIVTLIGGASLGCFASGQSLMVMGTASESTGAPLNFVRVTVKDQRGQLVSQTVTNGSGKFASSAVRGKLRVECKANSTGFAQDPIVLEPVEIPLGASSVETHCIFDEVTVSAEYWLKVAQFVGDKAQQTKSDEAFGKEWSRITATGLPPDSKAAAAHQFKVMRWSEKITDPLFKDYTGVDVGNVSKAINGDRQALSTLPGSVAKEVQNFKGTPAQ